MTPQARLIKKSPNGESGAILQRENVLRILADLKRRVKTLEEKLDEALVVVKQTIE